MRYDGTHPFDAEHGYGSPKRSERRVAEAEDFMWAWVSIAKAVGNEHLFGNGLWFGTDLQGVGGR